MLPQANQARKAIWKAINPHTGKRRIDEAFPIALRRTTNDQEMFIEFLNGSTWQVVGSDNYNSLVGSPPAGITFSEWALANPASWAYLSPILAENDGWAVFIYTSRGRNHGASLYETARNDPSWFADLQSVDETGVFTPDALEQAKRDLLAVYRDRRIADALYRQEYECSFDAAVIGAYYAPLLEEATNEGRVGRVPYDPAYPVITAWDLGIRDATAIWFCQVVGREPRLIDYYEATGEALPHYAKVLDAKRYLYSHHLLPHDAKVRELGTGQSRVETLQKLGVGNIHVVDQLPLMDGIDASRRLISRAAFDTTTSDSMAGRNGGRGLDVLRNYRAEWDEQRRTLKSTPTHDWSSHGADAFRMLAVGLDRIAGRQTRNDYSALVAASGTIA
jgi:hypothetical protein